jgi:ribosomal silencing factor RsfS
MLREEEKREGRDNEAWMAHDVSHVTVHVYKYTTSDTYQLEPFSLDD